MTFYDLPSDWPQRSLADPTLAADVVDLVVSDADRTCGGLSFLLCRPGGTLGQPVFISCGEGDDLEEVVRFMVRTATDHLPALGGLVLAIVKPRGGLSDADRRLHQRAIEICRAHGSTLWGTYLATLGGVSPLPVAPELAEERPGAA